MSSNKFVVCENLEDINSFDTTNIQEKKLSLLLKFTICAFMYYKMILFMIEGREVLQHIYFENNFTFSTLVGRKSMAALFNVTTVNEKREAPQRRQKIFFSSHCENYLDSIIYDWVEVTRGLAEGGAVALHSATEPASRMKQRKSFDSKGDLIAMKGKITAEQMRSDIVVERINGVVAFNKRIIKRQRVSYKD